MPLFLQCERVVLSAKKSNFHGYRLPLHIIRISVNSEPNAELSLGDGRDRLDSGHGQLMYALATIPLIKKKIDNDMTQIWYADDVAAKKLISIG